MGHADVQNRTPFVFEALYLADEETRPLLVPLVKATFDIGKDGRCARAEKQEAANLTGECWGEDPETSSYKFEPEVAFFKPATDVVLLGHAYPAAREATEASVTFKVGARSGVLQKEVAVFGERAWFKAAGVASATKPRPFEKMPLVYERAFGGWDRSHADPNKHTYEARNPIGVGYRGPGGVFEEGLRLPNLEDPAHLIKSLGDRPPPAGFGFVAPHWKPRAALAGTFDEAWQKSRAPLLPKDFDRRHLNAATPGLISSSFLRGDEPIVAEGVRPGGQTLSFTLPAVRPPRVQVTLVDGAATELPLNLDTVIVDADGRRVLLLWRGLQILKTGPHDVRAIEVSEAAAS